MTRQASAKHYQKTKKIFKISLHKGIKISLKKKKTKRKS